MTTHRIAILAGWYQVVETRDDGTVTPIGNFRTEAEAQDWLNTYLRTQNGPGVFKVGYSGSRPTPTTETEMPVTAPGSN